jgi:hypothetical protein
MPAQRRAGIFFAAHHAQSKAVALDFDQLRVCLGHIRVAPSILIDRSTRHVCPIRGQFGISQNSVFLHDRPPMWFSCFYYNRKAMDCQFPMNCSLRYYVRKLFPFFFEQEAAKKNQKTAVGEFRACGRDEGCAPSTCAAF